MVPPRRCFHSASGNRPHETEEPYFSEKATMVCRRARPCARVMNPLLIATGMAMMQNQTTSRHHIVIAIASFPRETADGMTKIPEVFEGLLLHQREQRIVGDSGKLPGRIDPGENCNRHCPQSFPGGGISGWPQRIRCIWSGSSVATKAAGDRLIRIFVGGRKSHACTVLSWIEKPREP